MKTLIVATDFSVPAENAMLYAGMLAEKLNTSILLLNIYEMPVSMNEMPVLIISAEELKNASDHGLRKAKELLQKSFPSLEIQTESRLGDINEELHDICSSCDPVAVVLGKHSTSGFERILFGSTSLSVIRHSNLPVIVVPDTATDHQLKNIGLAIDAIGPDIPEQKIVSFVEQLNAELFIVHVDNDKSAERDFVSLIQIRGKDVPDITIKDEEFVHGIESFVSQNQIDMIIILPHKHNLVERMFFKTHTKELMEKIHIPILCINED